MWMLPDASVILRGSLRTNIHGIVWRTDAREHPLQYRSAILVFLIPKAVIFCREQSPFQVLLYARYPVDWERFSATRRGQCNLEHESSRSRPSHWTAYHLHLSLDALNGLSVTRSLPEDPSPQSCHPAALVMIQSLAFE